MNDLRSGKEFWDEAREALGYTKEEGYDKKSLLFELEPFMGREANGDYTMEVQHDCRCDELSRQIANLSRLSGRCTFTVPAAIAALRSAARQQETRGMER